MGIGGPKMARWKPQLGAMNTSPSKPAVGVLAVGTQPVELAIASIRKQFGAGAIARLGSNEAVKVSVLSTGCPGVDVALGVGGLPKGRIVEIYGPESSGKTTFCLSVIAQAQRQGGVAAFVDVEHALDPTYARRTGVDVDNLLVSQPDCGEDALAIAETLIRSNAVEVVVVDSVAALVTRAELDGQMGDATVGGQARLMSQAMRRLTAAVSRSKCVCIFTNQIREKIGVMFGSPETTPGGRALKFFASVRLDIRKKDQLKAPDGTIIGNLCKIKVVKNKVAAPFTESDFEIHFDQGINRFASLLDLAVTRQFIDKKGAWFSMDGVLIGQGRDAAVDHLRQNPDLTAKLHQTIMAQVATKTVALEDLAERRDSEVVASTAQVA